MLELHISDKDATSGTVCLSWCVSKETLQELADKGVVNPLLVICIAPAYPNYYLYKEHRQIVPLKDLISFVELHCKGRNQIRAFIADSREKVSSLLDKEARLYSTSIVNRDGDEWASWIACDEDMQLLISQVLYVDVPAECFAKEPWDKAWVNWLFRDKSIDQCAYRRRRLFSYSVQVLLMAFYWLWKLFLCIAALAVGSRGFSFKYLLHPLTYDLGTMCDVDNDGIMSNGTVFVRRILELKEGASGWQKAWWIVRKFCLLPLMPVICVPLYLLYRTHLLLKLSLIGAAILFCGFIISLFATGEVKQWYYKLLDALSGSKPWYMDEEEQDLLVCGNKKAMKLSDLPASRRTIKLRFYDLKSRVCRPFSR